MSNVEAPANPLGRVSFWLGIAVVAAEVLRQLGQGLAFASERILSISMYYQVTGFVIFALAISALVTGIMAVVRPGLSRTYAAAGIALGGSSIVTGAAGSLSSLLIPIFGN